MRRNARLPTTARSGQHETCEAPAGLIELLEHGRDGQPRTIVVQLPDGSSAQRLARRVTADGRARGFVAMQVPAYVRVSQLAGWDLEDRTILLVAAPDVPERDAASALIAASAQSPRARVLLLLRADGPTVILPLREARARYGSHPMTRSGCPRRRESELEPYRTRALRAKALLESGRHAAAARLLREVVEAFRRRDSLEDSSRTLVALGRLLLERGRAVEADRIFDEAASAAQDCADDEPHLNARIWQIHARVDAGDLTQAEALCRAVLAGPRLSPLWQVRA